MASDVLFIDKLWYEMSYLVWKVPAPTAELTDIFIYVQIFLQCWWQLWGHIGNKSNASLYWGRGMETSCHISFFLWDGRRIFPLWWTNLRHEIWELDLWWISGNEESPTRLSSALNQVNFRKAQFYVGLTFSNALISEIHWEQMRSNFMRSSIKFKITLQVLIQ